MRVVYIAGCGRSGSTFLDVVLGSHPAITSVGELSKHIANRWSTGRLCSCGERVDECRFWCGIRDEWIRRDGRDAVGAYARLERLFDGLRDWPRLWRASQRHNSDFREYAARTKSLYESIGRIGGTRIVVDSSKLPTRAFALSRMSGIDLSLIHLIRDPRSVAWSHVRRARTRANARGSAVPTYYVAAEWTLRNVQLTLLRRRASPARSLLVRYEDLVSHPVAVLSRIGTLIGCAMEAIGADLVRGEQVPIGHVPAGNRLRLSRTVMLRPDLTEVRLPRSDGHLIRLLCGWGLRRYGYAL